MLPDAILSDVFRQISNPQVTCLSNHFAPNSSFGIGCCGIVWRHCTTTHNLDQGKIMHPDTPPTHGKNAVFSKRLKQTAAPPPFSLFPSRALSLALGTELASSALLSSLNLHRRGAARCDATGRRERDQFVTRVPPLLPAPHFRHLQFDFFFTWTKRLITSH